jgi:hypothetical protein
MAGTARTACACPNRRAHTPHVTHCCRVLRAVLDMGNGERLNQGCLMNVKPQPNRSQSATLQALAMSAAHKPAGPSRNITGASSRDRDESPRARSAGTVALLIAALGALSIAWAVHRQWSGEPGAPPDAEAPKSAVHRQSDALLARPLSTFTAAPAPLPAAGRVATAPAALPPGPQSPAVPANTEETGLLEALTAPQEDVRYHSLEQALGTGVDVPQDTLQDLLANDPSDGVRELALQGLTERPEATREEIRSILDAAVANPSAVVRASAQRIIEQMNALDEMDERAREFRRRAGTARNE